MAFIAPVTVAARDGRRHVQRVAAHRLRLRPDRRQPHGPQGLLPAASTSTRPTRWPTTRTRSAARACATSSSMQNGNRLLDGPQELGAVPLDAGRRRLRQRRRQHQAPVFAGDLDAPRARDHHRPVGPRLVRLQERPQRVGRDRSDPRGGDDDPVQRSRHRRRRRGRHRRRPDRWTLLDRPASTPQTRLYTNPTDPAYNSDFQTIEFAVNRRFAEQVDAADVVRLHVAEPVPRRDDRHRRARRAGAGARPTTGAPNQRLFGDEGKETSTLWNYKVIGRYVMPWEIGFSGSWKVQSGRQYGRSTSASRSPATAPRPCASKK